MGIETKTVTIDEVEYKFNTFTASKGLKYLKQLTTILGPSVSTLFGGTDDIGAIGISDLERAVSLLVDNMDKGDVESLMVNLTKEVQRDNVPINFDMEFAGNYAALFSLVIEIVKANYAGNFTLGGFNLGQMLGQKTALVPEV